MGSVLLHDRCKQSLNSIPILFCAHTNMHITSANLQMFFIPAKKYKKNLTFECIFLCADTKNIKKMPFFLCL